MDANRAYALIDSYDLDNCRTLLYVCAPDLCIELDDMIRRGADPQEALAAARSFVKQAYLRENN